MYLLPFLLCTFDIVLLFLFNILFKDDLDDGLDDDLFIGAVLDEPRPKARLWGTAAVACRCAQARTAVLRVHDVGPISQTLRMAAALW